jgi:PhzF family phenazine biosynthesis protein
MPERAFQQIDVFSHHPGFGNPVAVVLDAQGLSDADMRRFAAWTNLSETTFLMPPTAAGHAAGADYRLRIFSPRGELPFAGHPTLGTCRAWLQQGHTPRVPGLVVQESAQGLVQIEHQGDTLAFAAPPLQRSKPSPALVPLVASALGLRPHQIQAAQLLDNGPVWLGLLLDSADTVLGLTPDHARLKDLGQDVGVIHIAPDASRPRAPRRCGARLRRPHGQPGRPGDRQPQRQPGAVADCRRPGPHPLPGGARRMPGPRWPGVHPPGCPGAGLGGRPHRDLHRRDCAAVTSVPINTLNAPPSG